MSLTDLMTKLKLSGGARGQGQRRVRLTGWRDTWPQNSRFYPLLETFRLRLEAAGGRWTCRCRVRWQWH